MEVQVFLYIMLYPLVNGRISKDHRAFIVRIRQSNKGLYLVYLVDFLTLKIIALTTLKSQ